MRETTLCDICEGSDCNETCRIQASGQRSPKSAFDDEEVGRVMETSGVGQISVIWGLLIILTLLVTLN